MSNLPQAADTEPVFGSHKKTVKAPTADQQAIVDAINTGWSLYRNNSTFMWHVKRKADKPFKVTVSTLYKPTVVGMLTMGLIKEAGIASDGKNTLFVLK